MNIITEFYERHFRIATEQICALEQLKIQPSIDARNECVKCLKELVIHNRDLKNSYYCEMFERNILNRDQIVIVDPLAPHHVETTLTLIKRKLTGHYGIYELVLLKHVELCFTYGTSGGATLKYELY